MTKADRAAQEALDAMAASALGIAALTGMRQQFIDAGWSPSGAEQMTHALLMKSS